MLSLFSLYLGQHRHFDDSTAILIVGGFLSGSYLFSWPGGWLADRWLGALRTAQLGAVLLGLGYSALWKDAPTLFWPALAFALIGQGLFRSALTALVGRLYAAGDKHREAGFGRFYISVNLGYLTGPICAEAVRSRAGWPTIFGLAAAALLLALIPLRVCEQMISRQTRQVETRPMTRLSARDERIRIQTLYFLSAMSIVFWLAVQQSGTSLTLFAEEHTDRQLSSLQDVIEFEPGHFATLHGALVLGFTPLLISTLSKLRENSCAPSTLAQLAWGLVATAGAFGLICLACLSGGDHGRVHILWLVGCYGLLSIAEVLWGAMGLSLMMKLAPSRVSARMAGLWYSAVAAGNLGAGLLGPLWQRWPHHRYFAFLAMLVLGAASVMVTQLRTLDGALQAHRSRADG